MQWEIRDVLEGIAACPKNCLMVAPPFRDKPIKNPDWFYRELAGAADSPIGAKRTLFHRMEQLVDEIAPDVKSAGVESLQRAAGRIGAALRAVWGRTDWYLV
jgi:hypothetical protein